MFLSYRRRFEALLLKMLDAKKWRGAKSARVGKARHPTPPRPSGCMQDVCVILPQSGDQQR